MIVFDFKIIQLSVRVPWELYSDVAKVWGQHSGHPHRNTKIAITSQLSTTHYTTMLRSFGTEISGNRRRGFELTPAQRISIILKREEGLTVRELMAEFKCGRHAIYNTLN